MKLYMISTGENDKYDSYSRAVVAAPSEDDARKTHPDGRSRVETNRNHLSTWVPLSAVRVEYLGEAKPGTDAGVILASYHAG